jgi:hypothetical protein
MIEADGNRNPETLRQCVLPPAWLLQGACLAKQHASFEYSA